jgi:RNA polymerase sigma-70 factor (ECF subfamily)
LANAAHRLAAARAGSREALGEALEACRGYLLLVAEQELDPRLRAKGGASDLVQETFLEAQQAFARFHGSSEEELLAWLRQVLRHNLADFTRRYRAAGKRGAARERALETGSAGTGPGEGLVAPEPSASRLAIAQEQVEALQGAVDRLPKDYRAVILLRHQEKLSFEEIAHRMNRSIPAVRQLWSRAVRRVRLAVESRHESEQS